MELKPKSLTKCKLENIKEGGLVGGQQIS